MEKKDMLKTGSIFTAGYGIIPKLVMKNKDLSIEAKAIYAFLCSYAGRGDKAFPSVSVITGYLGISENRFYKHRKVLLEKGFLSLTKERHAGGSFKQNIYTVNTVVPHEQNLRADTPHADTQCVDKPHVDSMGSNNNSTNNNSIKNNSTINKEHERFEEFYNLYNKKKARPKASKAFWKAISNHDWEIIEKGTIDYLRSIRAGDEKFQAYPATFLNEERFLDDHEYVRSNIYEAKIKPYILEDYSDFLDEL
ncbi:helix-turn-helix domain-containing protein [Salinicoccus sesuvii]|uniref:Helix-turn-helix domain-containing protein n=1 Tax=Salinicoccus sesuvii TaxID=868281 RepID=A0ABV7N4P5_9STAP